MIARENLKDGRYYIGYCRNSYIGLWDEKASLFRIISYQFSHYLDTVKYLGDIIDTTEDGFIPIEEIKSINEENLEKIKKEVGY